MKTIFSFICGLCIAVSSTLLTSCSSPSDNSASTTAVTQKKTNDSEQQHKGRKNGNILDYTVTVDNRTTLTVSNFKISWSGGDETETVPYSQFSYYTIPSTINGLMVNGQMVAQGMTPTMVTLGSSGVVYVRWNGSIIIINDTVEMN